MNLRWNYFARRRRSRAALFVLAEGRTGSTLLVDLLGSVPGVATTGEVLNQADTNGLRTSFCTKGAALRHVRWSIALPGSCVVAKLDPWHLRSHGVSYGDLCDHFPEARFVILYRRNLADQYVSWCRLFLTGENRAGSSGKPRVDPVTIDAEHFKVFCRQRLATYQAIVTNHRLRERSVIVSYEELAADAQAVYERKVRPLVGLPSALVASGMTRQRTEPLSRSVANFEEMRPYFESPDAWLDLGG